MTASMVSILCTLLIGSTCFADSIGPDFFGPNCWHNLDPKKQNGRDPLSRINFGDSSLPITPSPRPLSIKPSDFFNFPQIVVIAGKPNDRAMDIAVETLPTAFHDVLIINSVGPINISTITAEDVLKDKNVQEAIDRWINQQHTVLIVENKDLGAFYKDVIQKYLLSLDIADAKIVKPNSIVFLNIEE